MKVDDNHFWTNKRWSVSRRMARMLGQPVFVEGGAEGECHGATSADYGPYVMCGRNAKYEYEGLSFCGTHHPPKVKERRDKRDAEFHARYEANRKRWKAEQWESKARERAWEALNEIAKGEMNDPAGYAAMILDELNAEKP